MNWKNRGDRLARLKESDEFTRYFMPVAYLIGVVGIGVVVFEWVGKVEGGAWSKDMVAIGGVFAVFPVLMFLFRLTRGHYSKRLKD